MGESQSRGQYHWLWGRLLRQVQLLDSDQLHRPLLGLVHNSGYRDRDHHISVANNNHTSRYWFQRHDYLYAYFHHRHRCHWSWADFHPPHYHRAWYSDRDRDTLECCNSGFNKYNILRWNHKHHYPCHAYKSAYWNGLSHHFYIYANWTGNQLFRHRYNHDDHHNCICLQCRRAVNHHHNHHYSISRLNTIIIFWIKNNKITIKKKRVMIWA